MTSRTVVSAFLLAAAASCSGKIVPAGGIFLVMCTDGTLEPDALHLVVTSSDGSKKYKDDVYDLRLRGLPASLAIASNGNAGASVVIDVGVWNAGSPLDVRHYVVTNIPTDRVAELDVIFSASCASGVSCASSDVPADRLPVYGGTGTSVKCAAPDAGRDTGGATDVGTPDASAEADAGALDAGTPDQSADATLADAQGDVDARVEVDAAPPCTLLAERCKGNVPQTCNASGKWEDAPSCVPGITHCSGVRCVPVPPSCADAPPGAGADCSSAGNGDCCASYDVAGGSFFRDYDGFKNVDRSAPASVSSFRLDAYEITVGRFRQFVDAVVGGWRPDAGAGKHVHLRQGMGLLDMGEAGTTFETGWDPSWNANLPPAVPDWSTKLACGSTATWTPNRGVANEKLPITCVDWYAVYAFCIWDGGFLPSTAEWNYAAAGGADQRIYAWGNDPPGEDTTLAIWGCHFGGGFCQGLVNVAPVGTARAGDGKWGQSDLTGSVWEWVLDFQADYFVPCTDCAATTGLGHVLRGGAFNNYAEDLQIAHHLWSRMLHTNVGARCARPIP